MSMEVVPTKNVGVEATSPPDKEVFEKLAAEHAALKITIHDLECTRPSMLFSHITFLFSFCLFGVAVWLLITSYFTNTIQPQFATVAAFLVVIFAFTSYTTFRKVVADHEQWRLHQAVSSRAKYLEEIAYELLSAPKDSLKTGLSNAE